MKDDALRSSSEPPRPKPCREPQDERLGTKAQTNSLSKGVERLLALALERGALKYGDFTLSSGLRSSYYFDGRLLSLDPEGAALIGRLLLPLVREAGASAIGGPTLGADPIVAAVALTSHLEGTPVSAFIVRKEAKGHGTHQEIEGPLGPGSQVAIVDDVCTTASSLFRAIEAAEAAGCQVVRVLSILDRQQGGSEELRRRGYDFVALLEATPEGRVVVPSTLRQAQGTAGSGQGPTRPGS